MLSNAPFFLALRYLRPKRSFVSVITLISVMGVMLGVGVLVVVMSVFQGWQVEFKKLLLGFEPHVTLIQDARYTGQLPEGVAEPVRSNWREVLKRVKTLPGVESATPMAEGYIGARNGASDPEPAELFGLRDDTDNGLLHKLSRHIKEGEFNLKDDNIIITDRLAKKLNVKVGDVLSILARETIRQMIHDLRAAEEATDPAEAKAAREEIVVLPRDLTVVGIVRADTAGERCYAPLNIAQELFNLEGDVTGIEIELADPELADAFAQHLFETDLLPMDWAIRTWSHTHGSKLMDVENQRSLMYFLLLFIMLVAAICVMNTTITVTVQKRREIGILTALGSRVWQIISIFLAQAGVVAVVGTLLGILGGMTVLHFRNDLREKISEITGRDFFPQDIYFLSEIPSQVQLTDIVSICGLAIVLCLLAALIPAWFAARVDPAVALRD
ncbi:lipoprotein-releasing system permease protein [Prosthecobacter debontii]|uniref:Lipoprotein-releasing system permease protein n=1 Tax=Prosthecobacter debontii TaxID=48467 RepID=A0A1T4Y6X7_9BACT|nr:FtsX-like permease family protein [Prosthecobacter debontii]SKA97015.1 lipoprotein-releasing system permease protein [Prosthecobacter debontii]